MMPVWLALGSLSLGFPSAVLSVLEPLKYTWIPFLLHTFFEFFTCIGNVGNHYGGLVFGFVCWVVVIVVVGGVVGMLL